MKKVTGTDTKTRPPMAMKIIIGKFGEDGEPIWFEVETNEWKDENGNWKDVSKGVKTNEDAGNEDKRRNWKTR